MPPQLKTISSIKKKYFQRKNSELRILSRFGMANQLPRLQHYSSVDDIFSAKLQIKAAIRAQSAMTCQLGESNLRASEGRHTSSVFGLPFLYDYQRIRVDLKALPNLKYVYPGLRRPLRSSTVGFFTSSCQVAISAVFLTLSLMKRERKVQLYDGAYWETLSFLRTFSFHFSQKKNRPPVKTLYFDSSTLQQNTPEPTPKDLRGHDLLIVDTTCFPLHSKSLANLLAMASDMGIPSILVRSHMKLDCLGMEYGRLGSIVLVWNSKKPSASRFAKDFMSQLHGISNLMGLPASVSQIYPFLSSKTFQKHNSKWIQNIQNNNKRLVEDLQSDPLVNDGPFILTTFKHGLFFWISFKDTVSEKKMGRLLGVLSRLLAHSQIPHKNIASYPWDFVGITPFMREAPFLTGLVGKATIRFSISDLDEETFQKTALCFHLWFRKIKKRLG